MKRCVDCIKLRRFGIPWIAPEYLCQVKVDVDPVTGDPDPVYRNPWHERGMQGSCGPDARNFVPKDADRDHGEPADTKSRV